MRRVRVPKSACPHCGHEMDGACNPLSLESPSKGDVSVCIRCANPLKFGENLQLQKLETRELFRIQLEHPDLYTNLLKFQQHIRELEGDRT